MDCLGYITETLLTVCFDLLLFCVTVRAVTVTIESVYDTLEKREKGKGE